MANNKSQVNSLFAGLNKQSNTDKIAKTSEIKKIDIRDIDDEEEVNDPEEKSIVNINDSSNIIYKTNDYSIFLPYPKEELRLALHTGEQRKNLKDSIEKHGITTPIKVSPISNGKYVVLGGHNRLDIAKELRIEVPYMILLNLSEEEQDEIVAEEHILNRQQSDLKPSQMMKLLKAIWKTSENQKELIEKASMSKSSIYRFLSFENLSEEILYELVDTQRLSLNSAAKLSTYSPKAQKQIFDYIQSNKIRTISEKPLKKLFTYNENEWSNNLFDSLFSQNNTNKNESIKIEIPIGIIDRKLTSNEKKEIENIVYKYIKSLNGH